MCGIAGILSLSGENVSPAIINYMADAIGHRGPDGAGTFVRGPFGIGHRRLAIIDLSPSGDQPMTTPDGRYVIGFNGEIYNFKELRSELETFGWQFRSTSDTEVLLNAWAQWGEAALNKLNGMFAFALWDQRSQKLTLARDRYGIKPLYYSCQGKSFLFASEIKALLRYPEYSCGLDQEALVEYFTFQNFFTDRTLFRGVRMLPSGSSLTIKPQLSWHPVPAIYWDYHFQEPEKPLSDEEYVEELDRLFRQAVNRQMVSDVEVGTYLSGGMDSGSITAVAARQQPYLKTFTCGFDLHSASGVELAFDEREKAEHMSYLFKTEHYEMVLKAGDMERVMPKLVHHIEEPRVGQSYPNYYVAQLARKFVKVVLAGTGGDELFGGYPWRYYRAVVNDDFDHYVDKYYQFWNRIIPNQVIKEVLSPIWADVGHVSTRDIFRDVFQDHAKTLTRPEDYINHSLYFEAKTFLHGLLVIEDKLSMAHGLETRVPFLDNDLVDFALKMPVRLKLRNLQEIIKLNENEPGIKSEAYFQRTRDGKVLLRRVMERYVPPEVSGATKQGFSGPDASWFRGESIEYVRRVVFDDRSRIYEVLDRSSVRRLVGEHLNGSENRRLFIWSLLNFEGWLREFLA